MKEVPWMMEVMGFPFSLSNVCCCSAHVVHKGCHYKPYELNGGRERIRDCMLDGAWRILIHKTSFCGLSTRLHIKNMRCASSGSHVLKCECRDCPVIG